MVENLLSVTRINDTVTHQVNKTPEIVEEVVAEAVQRLKKDFLQPVLLSMFQPIIY